MEYNPYKQNKKHEELPIYKNEAGFVISQDHVYLAYSCGNMSQESTERFERNNPEYILPDREPKNK